MTVFLADYSHYQAGLSIGDLRHSGIAAVIVKATQGVTWTDPTLHANLDDAINDGMPVAVYHYLTPGNEVEQAAHTHAVVSTRIPVWVDVEGAATRDGAYAYADAYRKLGGIIGGIYSSRKPKPGYGGWWRAAYLTDPHGFTVDTYRRQGGDAGAGWSPNPDIWQYCQHGKVPGYSGDVDFNAYRGTLRQLTNAGWFYTGELQPVPTPPPVAPINVAAPKGTPVLFIIGNNVYLAGGDSLTVAGKQRTVLHRLPGGPSDAVPGGYHDFTDAGYRAVKLDTKDRAEQLGYVFE